MGKKGIECMDRTESLQVHLSGMQESNAQHNWIVATLDNIQWSS